MNEHVFFAMFIKRASISVHIYIYTSSIFPIFSWRLSAGAECDEVSDAWHDSGRSPLQAAAENGHCEVVQLLADAGAAILGRDGCSVVNLWTDFKWVDGLYPRKRVVWKQYLFFLCFFGESSFFTLSRTKQMLKLIHNREPKLYNMFSKVKQVTSN